MKIKAQSSNITNADSFFSSFYIAVSLVLRRFSHFNDISHLFFFLNKKHSSRTIKVSHTCKQTHAHGGLIDLINLPWTEFFIYLFFYLLEKDNFHCFNCFFPFIWRFDFNIYYDAKKLLRFSSRYCQYASLLHTM